MQYKVVVVIFSTFEEPIIQQSGHVQVEWSTTFSSTPKPFISPIRTAKVKQLRQLSVTMIKRYCLQAKNE